MFNFTIKILFIGLLLTGSGTLLQVNAQQWNGPNNINGNIWRNGNVGIGINNPSRPFQLRGSNSVLQIDRDTKDPGFGVTRYSPGFGNVWKSFFFYTEGTGPNNGRFIIADWGTQVSGPSTPRLVIGNTGNIGLGGELNPSYPLHINGSASTGIQYNGPNGFAGTYMNGGLPFYGYKRDNSIIAYHYMDNDNNWRFYNGGTQFIIEDGGDVGIGLTNPSYKLHIEDNAQVGLQIDAGDATWGGMYLNAKSGGKPFYGYKTNGTARAWSYVDASDNSWRLSVNNADRFIVQANGYSRFNGGVGINVNPPSQGLRVGNAEGLGSRITFGSAEYFQDIGSASIEVNGDLISAVNGFDDLGTSAMRWRNLYLSGSVVTSSDKRLKEDIRKLESPLQKVLQLNPVSYAMKNAKTKEPHVGLIAQEVMEVIPEIVYDPTKDMVRNEEGGFEPASTDKDALLGIKYIELIPYLVAALQEQENTIFELKNELAEMKAKASLQGNDPTNMNQPKLYQNQPNPFDQSTKIRVFLPESVQSAVLYIYDMQGTELKRMTVKGRGETDVEIESNFLKSGIYFYSLIADNKEVGTNRMILR